MYKYILCFFIDIICIILFIKLIIHIKFLYEILLTITYIYILINLIYVLYLYIKNNKIFKSDSLTLKKINKNEIFYPYEIIIDLISIIVNKKIKYYDLLSILILIIISPIINILIILYIIFITFYIIIYYNKILIGIIFGDKIELDGESRYNLLKLIKICKIVSFNIIYHISKENLTYNQIKKNLTLIFISRVYGKSILIIKIYIYSYNIIYDIIKNINYKNKKIIAIPYIFYHKIMETYFEIEENYYYEILKKLENKKIYIINKKIRKNPSKLTEEILKMHKDCMSKNVAKNILENYNLSYKYAEFTHNYYKKYDNYISVKTKNVSHMSRNIIDVNGKQSLVQIYTSKNEIKNKLFYVKAEDYTITSYHEDMIAIQESSEKCMFDSLVYKNKITKISNERILRYYTNDNLKMIPFLNIQDDIRFSKKIFDKSLKVVYHDEKSNPTKLIYQPEFEKIMSNDDLSKKFTPIHNAINSEIDKVWKIEKNKLNINSEAIIKKELMDYLYYDQIHKPKYEFQEYYADILAEIKSSGVKDKYIEILSEIKNL